MFIICYEDNVRYCFVETITVQFIFLPTGIFFWGKLFSNVLMSMSNYCVQLFYQHLNNFLYPTFFPFIICGRDLKICLESKKTCVRGLQAQV